MEKNNDNAVILFARDPILGQVKTRLNSLLDNETILKLIHVFWKTAWQKFIRLIMRIALWGFSQETTLDSLIKQKVRV